MSLIQQSQAFENLRLPLEVLYLIIDEVDDVATLLTCKLTCSSFRAAAANSLLRYSRQSISVKDDFEVLHERLGRDPLFSHHVEDVSLRSSALLTEFIYEFAGKFDNLQYLDVWSHPDLSSPPLILRPLTFMAWSHFKSLTRLSLNNVKFWSFKDFARFISTISNLLDLELSWVYWTIDGERSLERDHVNVVKHLRYADCG
ncbi:hypothetical protein OBBRIDRAFT_791166 [Obba rivulosa]|uniref:F-box domain-containing protein n=1 Tax=Obba rivulosa TaxID=1052685 RepID=A0A8E2B2D1_9APHY|nr:hypothetical protein OBBRIDRAFT_791166 [Obba rivulosa]